MSVSLCGAGRVAVLDDGDFKLFVGNDGSYAYDKEESLDGVGGLYYPKNTLNVLMAGAGVWVAGKLEGDWRVSIAGGPSEFVPGPAYTYDSNLAEFPVYRLTRGEDYFLNDDYRNWPVTLGAPLDQFGRPLIMGSQCLFTVFADTDTAAHRFSISGTPPLGVEGQLYAYTYDHHYQTEDTLLTQIVFLEYALTNVSSTVIESCVVTCYADPDLGYGYNDLIASDSVSRACYCYNETNYDSYFGHNPPVIGITLLEGELSSTNFYHARSDLDSLLQTVYLVNGLDLAGQPYVDPTTEQATRFPYGGDPTTQTGWVNTESQDYRLMLNLSPVDLGPGERIRLKMALVLTHGSSVMHSVGEFRQTARMLQNLQAASAPLQIEMTTLPVFTVSEALQGRDWGGRFLNGGLDLASRFLRLPDRDDPLPRVRLLFSEEPVQRAYRYRPSASGYLLDGVEMLPLEAFDDISLERLDLAYLDSDNDGSFGLESHPTEPILVFDRVAGSTRVGPRNQPLMDAADQLVLALQLEQTAARLAGRRLTVSGSALRQQFLPITEVIDLGDLEKSAVSERTLRLHNSTRFTQYLNVVADDPEFVRVNPVAFDLGAGENKHVFLQLVEPDSGAYSSSIRVTSYGFEQWSADFELLAEGTAFAGAGDVDGNGVLGLGDVIRMIGMLYAEEPTLLGRRELDADCDGDFDLADLVAFVNALFFAVETACR